MAVDAKVIFVATAGAIFVYSGVRGIGLSTTARDLLSGQNPDESVNSSGGVGIADEPTSETASTKGMPSAASVLDEYGIGTDAAPIVANGSVSQNKAMSKFLAASAGWSGEQWSALEQLWTRESGFRNTAKNPKSGAYGIAQALPATKYPAAGQASGGSNPYAQIVWGLKYIKTRYGSPLNALAHENKYGWY
jgi:resuscitation-promoting factor RpfB